MRNFIQTCWYLREQGITVSPASTQYRQQRMYLIQDDTGVCCMLLSQKAIQDYAVMAEGVEGLNVTI